MGARVRQAFMIFVSIGPEVGMGISPLRDLFRPYLREDLSGDPSGVKTHV